MLLAVALIGDAMLSYPGQNRGALLRFPKRKLSPLRRACVSLGLKVDARPTTNLAWLLRRAGLGKTGIEYLKWSNDEQARQIVKLYHSLNRTERKAVTIDYLIMAAKADVHHISGVIQEEHSRLGGIEAGMLLYMSAPEVVRKAIEHAKTPGGHRDRRMLLGRAGLIPLQIPLPSTKKPAPRVQDEDDGGPPMEGMGWDSDDGD